MSPGNGMETLTPDELAALRSAGSWYAKYHASIIAEHADDGSAYAVAQRERYRDLVQALRKLGVMVPEPDAIRQERQAA